MHTSYITSGDHLFYYAYLGLCECMRESYEHETDTNYEVRQINWQIFIQIYPNELHQINSTDNVERQREFGLFDDVGFVEISKMFVSEYSNLFDWCHHLTKDEYKLVFKI